MMNATAMGPSRSWLSVDRLKDFVSNYGENAKEGAKTIFASQVAAEGWRDVFTGIKGSIGGGTSAVASGLATTEAAAEGLQAASRAAATASGTAAVNTAGGLARLAPVGRDAAGRFLHLDVARLVPVGRDAAGRFIKIGASGGAAVLPPSVATGIVADAPSTGIGGWFKRLFGGAPKVSVPGTPAIPGTSVVPTVPGAGAVPALPPVSAGPLPFAGPSKVSVNLEFSTPATAREVTTVKIIREPVKGLSFKAPNGVSAVADSTAVGANGATGATGSTGATAGQAGSALKAGLGKIWEGAKSGAKSGALFSGIISGVIHTFKVVTGKERVGEGVGSVAADTASGAVSGAVGAVGSGLAIAAATAFGLTAGLPLTILGIVGGLGGALLGGAIFKKTGIYDAIKGLVSKVFGG